MSEYTVEQDMIITAVTRKLVEEHERDAFPDPKDVHGPVEGPPSEALVCHH